MFGNLGMGELIIIAGIALVVIGPEKFPEFAKIALRAYRDLRGYVDDIKREMAEEMTPVKNELRELSRFKPEDYIENVAKAVAALDEPEQKKEEPQAPDTKQQPPGDWSGGADDTLPPVEPASEHHAESSMHAEAAPQHHAEGESEPSKDNIYG